MELANLFAQLESAGVKIYGSSFWKETQVHGRIPLTIVDGKAEITGPNGKSVWAYQAKGAVESADGTQELFTAIADRAFSGERDGKAFTIEAGEPRLFWR
jgi:hypothetical protein